jgi:hypothetical protein
VLTDIVANPVNTYAAPAENELSQLADALGQVHPALARMQEKEDHQARQDAIIAAKAAAERAPDPVTADPSAITAATPPAFRHDAGLAFQEGIGNRLGVNAKGDFLDAYTKASKDPEFNFDCVLRGLPREAPRGPEQPRRDRRGQAHRRGDLRRARRLPAGAREAGHRDAQREPLVGALRDRPQRGAVPADARLPAAAESHVKQGGTRAEAAQMMLDQMHAQSTSLGGRPDMFAVFDTEVPGLGKKLGDLVPGLKSKVAAAQKEADTQLKHTLQETTLVSRGEQVDRINKMIEDGTAMNLGEEGFATYLKQFVGPTGAIESSEKFASFMHAYRTQAAVLQDKATTANLLVNHAGWALPEKQAKAVLGDALNRKGVMGALVQSMSQGGDPAQFSAAVNAIVDAHATTGVSFPDDRLKQLIGSIKQDVPKDGADVGPKFQGLARMYAAMEQRSAPLLNAYFDQDTRDILSEYNRLTVNGQVSSPSAYKMAYAMVDPDNKKAAEERMKDPAFHASVISKARGAVESWTGQGAGAFIGRFSRALACSALDRTPHTSRRLPRESRAATPRWSPPRPRTKSSST